MNLLSKIEAKYVNHERVTWLTSFPFLLMHVMPLGVLFTQTHWLRDLSICVALYYIRMFFISAGYHRYFSHRSYKLGRIMQFLMAFGGSMAAQKGVLWWAANHRHHHKHSDQPEDIHSPKDGLFWSHVGWILSERYEKTQYDLIPDFAKYPELRWLNKYHLVPPTLLAVAVFFIFGPSALFIGFFLSTVILYHGTFTINSLMHLIGKRRFATTDTSRNSMILALITCGEGWHNNHHHYQGSTSQGYYWWEIDLSFYALKILQWLGLAEGVRRQSKIAMERRLIRDGYADLALFQSHLERAMRALREAKSQTTEICQEKIQTLEATLKKIRETSEQIGKIQPSSSAHPSY